MTKLNSKINSNPVSLGETAMAVVRQCSMDEVQDEVRALVTRGSVGRQQRIYELSRYFSDREWPRVEQLLEEHNYLLRDCVIDLIGKEYWCND